MRKVLMFLLIIGVSVTSPLFACKDDVACDKCAKVSEHSWNPNNAFVTDKLQRFYSLDDQIKDAYLNSDLNLAKTLISEYLQLADVYRCNWNYGNAVHDANRYLGLISLSEGKIDEATSYLISAGKSTGSPQLNSFGPELDLANNLLKRGKTKEVLIYLNDVELFWELNDGRINKWIGEIENGNKPELNRFIFKQGFWSQVIIWVSALWPIFIVALFLLILRNKVHKKILFGTTSIATGYATMLIANFASQSIVTGVIKQLIQSGNDTLLILSIYAFTGAVYIIPIIAVYAVTRFFINKDV